MPVMIKHATSAIEIPPPTKWECSFETAKAVLEQVVHSDEDTYVGTVPVYRLRSIDGSNVESAKGQFEVQCEERKNQQSGSFWRINCAELDYYFQINDWEKTRAYIRQSYAAFPVID